MPRLMAVLFSLSLISIFPQAASASSFHENEAKFASGTGNTIFLVLGTLLPLATDGKLGKDHSLRALDALLTSTIICKGLKKAFHEERPNGKGFDSFPSGHATAAFAIATVESTFHPKQTAFWCLGAGLIGESRIKLKDHFTQDVIFGSALGYASAEWELSSSHGLILSPIIAKDGKAAGVKVTKVF